MDAAQRWGIENDALNLEAELKTVDESTPRDGGTIKPDRIYAAVERAREHPGRPSKVDRWIVPWESELVSILCRKIPGAEETELRAFVVVSVGKTRRRCLENLVQAMRAMQANAEELAVGNRAHNTMAQGYGIACMFLPGTRRPLSDEPASSVI